MPLGHTTAPRYSAKNMDAKRLRRIANAMTGSSSGNRPVGGILTDTETFMIESSRQTGTIFSVRQVTATAGLSLGQRSLDEGEFKVYMATANTGMCIALTDGAGTNVWSVCETGGIETTLSIKLPITTVTVNTTLNTTHHTVLVDASGGNRVITLPAVATSQGLMYHIKKIDSSTNNVTIDGNAAETIDDITTAVTNTQYESFTVHCDGTEWWII